MSSATSTPARRAAQRRAASISLPPTPPTTQRRVDQLKLVTAEATVDIGTAIVNDPPRTMALGETSTLQFEVRDDSGRVREALVDKLKAIDGATVTVDGIVYVYNGHTGARDLTISFEDEVSWRMKIYRSFLAYPRARFTRAEAVRELVREAGSAPMTPLRYWIPELFDRQRIATPVDVDGGPSTDRGTGRDPGYKVKGTAANAAQRTVIDAILTRCRARSASTYVQDCALMTATQESVMGEKPVSVSGKHLGPFHQDAAYGSEATRRNPGSATDGFLNEWQRIHGSLRAVSTSKASAIERVQRSGQGGEYAKWEAEATANRESWNGGTSGTTAGDGATEYEFTRGDRDGGRETSIAAVSRWSQDVRWQWWTMLNTFCYASEDELRAGAPALHISGDEPWLLTELAGDFGATRATSEVTFDVLASRWGLLPGACVTIDRRLPDLAGRWIVSRVDDTLYGLKATVTLKRPVEPGLEPAAESSSGGDSETTGDGSIADRLYSVEGAITDRNYPYVWGGGHRSAGTPDRGTGRDPGIGYDCSGSVGAALAEVGGLGITRGQQVAASGWFASSWGKPGKGSKWTIWANATHVWIEHHGGDREGHRFDTSPYGDGGRGPRLRTKARPTAGFTPRHWEGQ